MDNMLRQNGLICGAMPFALVIALIVANPCAASHETSPSKKEPSITGSQYVYYPDKAKNYFNYENTGAFVARPMVIPLTLPIITQPTYLYMDTPEPKITQAPLPILDTHTPPQ